MRILMLSMAALVTVRAAVAQVAVPLPPEARLLLRADFDRRIADTAAGPAARPGALREGLGAAFALTRGPGGSMLVDVFVRGGAEVEAALRASGARVGSRAGAWVTARLPLDSLRALARLPGVRSVEVARRARLTMDSSMVDIGAVLARTRAFRDQYRGATGRGAIVGFVDTGIDWRHPDFLEDDLGRSRILYIWDQTVTGTGPGLVSGTSFDYGLECGGASLVRGGDCPETDSFGHGTHVAGIAVSDGSGVRLGLQTFDFAGVAPAAEIIAVKTDLSFASIVDGVNYIFRRAEQLGRPAVVNLSLGSQVGPHDGSEAPSLSLDALTGPGRIIVVAAGNDGDNQNGGFLGQEPAIHGDTAVPVNDTATFTFGVAPYVPRSGGGNDLVLLQAYHSPLDSFSITLQRPNSSTITMPASLATTTSLDPGGAAVVYHGSVRGDSILGPQLETGSFSPTSTSATVEFFLGEWVSGGAAPLPGTWKVKFTRVGGTGNGEIDLYASLTVLQDVALSIGQGARNRRLVGTPGDARTVITVGAYSTRMRWRAIDGLLYEASPFDSVATGDVLLFSAPGPTRDGRLKPEISAPGRVFSTLSANAFFPIPLVATDSAHGMLEGTSMSTPHVAGAVALLLARRPAMTPAQVLAAFTTSARVDAFSSVTHSLDPGTPNNTWGYGKLDVPGALALVPPVAGRAIAVTAPPDTTVVSSRRGTVVPLQRIRLGATDAESLAVRAISAQVSGRDRGFRLALVLDANHDGKVGANETMLTAADSTVLDGTASARVDVPDGAIVIPQGGTTDLLLAGVLSGAAPNATVFTGTLLPDSSETSGLRSALTVSLDGAVVSGPQVRTSLMAAGERLNLSQNPVRSAPLVVNFGGVARRLTIFDFSGKRVASFAPAAADRDVRWDLRTSGGDLVANGAYVLVAELATGTVRRTIFVAR